jgi:hypothetical protein
MNEFDPSLDEIVSAYVDGAATPDERARVESDPALIARAATFRQIHAAVAAAHEPATVEQRNALITRALMHSAPVHDIRSRRFDMVGPIAAAAVIIAVLFGLGTWLVAVQDDDSSGSASTAAATVRTADGFSSAESADAAKSLGSAATTAAGGSAAAPQTATAARVPVALGRFDDQNSLRQALVSARDSSGAAPSTTAPASLSATTTASSCPRPDLVDPTVYTAELQGRPVTVFVTGTRADLIDNATCARTTIDLATR